jgi:NADH dehydrogenase FAD-containing subunit
MGSAVDLDMSERLVEVEVPSDQGTGTCRAYVPCMSPPSNLHLEFIADELDDKIVIACGSTSNDHGVKGLEHCFQLKTIPDAQAIRRRVMSELNHICISRSLKLIDSQLGTRISTYYLTRREETITVIRHLWRRTYWSRVRC